MNGLCENAKYYREMYYSSRTRAFSSKCLDVEIKHRSVKPQGGEDLPPFFTRDNRNANGEERFPRKIDHQPSYDPTKTRAAPLRENLIKRGLYSISLCKEKI